MNNNLFESQLCQKQADLFLLFFDYNFDIEATIELFMNSEIASRFDKEYDSYQYQNTYKIFDDFEAQYVFEIETKKSKINKDIIEYIGYLYRYISINKKISSKKIIKICPVKSIIDHYTLWHTFSFDKVIDLVFLNYRKNRINHDRYEVNKKSIIKIDKDDPHLYSFLGKRILYKLNRDPIIKNLIFDESRQDYLFKDENKKISLEVSCGNELINLFIFENKFINELEASYIKNILFIFLDSSLNDDELNYIYQNHFSNQNNFDDIYIYYDKNLYLIDSSNDLTKLPLLITKCDYNIAYKEALKFADK